MGPHSDQFEQEDRKDIADRLRQNRVRGRHFKQFVQPPIAGTDLLAKIFPEIGLQIEVRQAIGQLLGTHPQAKDKKLTLNRQSSFVYGDLSNNGATEFDNPP